MIKSSFLFFLFALSALASFSQTESQTQKECRITSGIGIAAATKNTKSPGKDV
ncbi:MAG: hypothetical protein ABIP30_15510 [Ferruginibacter sp.]